MRTHFIFNRNEKHCYILCKDPDLTSNVNVDMKSKEIEKLFRIY